MDTHAREAEEFARLLRQTEDGSKALDSCQQLLEDPEQNDFTAAVGQPYDGWTDGQLSALGQIAALYQGEEFDVIRIRVGAAPSNGYPDVDRCRLAKLPDLFVPLVYDRPTPSGDGIFSWKAGASADLPCGWAHSAPLSIGYADASRTFQHLTDRGAVARWPHGSEDLWLFGFTSFTSWVAWKHDDV